MPFALKLDPNAPNDLAAVLPPEEALTGGAYTVASMLLKARLITGPLPNQKLYPCNHPEKAWKGGCWNRMILEGATREEKVANCKTTDAYEPEPGWCEKTGGHIYEPVRLKQEKEPPPVSVE